MKPAGTHLPPHGIASGAPQPAQRLDDPTATPPAGGWWGGRSCFACCVSRTNTSYQDTLDAEPGPITVPVPLYERDFTVPVLPASEGSGAELEGPGATAPAKPLQSAPAAHGSVDAAYLTPPRPAARARASSLGLPGSVDGPSSSLRPADTKQVLRRRSLGDAVQGTSPSPSGITPPRRQDPKALLAEFQRILESTQTDQEVRRELLAAVRSAVRSRSMTGALLRALCASVLASAMPRESQRYFLSAAFDACRSVLALDDVIALREAIGSQGWETIAALQTLANLYGAGAGCLNREAALAEWAAAKTAYPHELTAVRLWIRDALQSHASRSDFS